MERMKDQHDRCAVLIQHLNDTLGWELTWEEQQAYRDQLCRYLPHDWAEARLRALIVCYHADHALVKALGDHQHPAHADTWQVWMGQVVAILKQAGLAWSSDAAVELDDLVQVARVELVRSLPSFQYHSRFSTWAYRVVVQSVQRYIRDSQARKRAGHPASLEQLPQHEVPGYAGEYLEDYADGRLLLERISRILAAHPDNRLAYIFRCWALADQRTEEIGALIQLSPARTRALLAQARALLRDHPDIRPWQDGLET